MGFINVAERTINAKLVYYGVGVGGKTTSLQQVHGILCPRNEVQLVSINTEQDSTLMFDFLPINLGNVGGFKIRIQGFTVPGQPKYRQMRKYVLQGADSVVFVVDSQRSRLQENLESFASMREHLRSMHGAAADVPVVMQYNKRDLDDILDERELDREFRYSDEVPTFPSVATEGQGVFEAFVESAVRLVERKVVHYGLARGDEVSREVAEGVREKLWSICDQARRGREVVPPDELPLTVLSMREPDEDVGAPRAGDDEFELRYELREEVGQSSRAAEVVTDVDVDVEISVPRVESNARARHDDDGASLLDTSLRSNLELAERFGRLDEERLLLERKVHELVDVAQQTVHDLNRPLSAVRLMLSTLDKGYLGELTSPVHQAVQHGLAAMRQMERLVRDLLDSSRLDHDGVQMTFAECDLGQVVAEVLETLRYELAEHAVTVHVGELPVVRADGWALTRVLLNLIGNAIAYRCSESSPEVHVGAVDAGDEWVLSIRDNGIGIPAQDHARLFRRFERGSNAGGVSGTGLGLHIVKEITQGHGGSVSFESEIGKGTTFFLRLPKQPVLAPHSPVSETAERADL
jgi:mutual gliding-motility protein MglA